MTSPDSVTVSPVAVQTILATLLADEALFLKWWPEIGLDFFDDEYYRRIAEFVDDFYRRYGQAPSFETLQDNFKTDPALSLDEQEVFQKVIEDIISAPVEDWPFYEARLRLYVRKQAFTQASEDATRLIDRLDFDGVFKRFQEASLAGMDRDDGTVGFFDAESIEERFNRRTEVGSLVPRLALQMGNVDSALGGGLKPKTLTVFVGTTGAGKSTALVHVGRHAVLQNFRVLHVTLELSKDDIVDKYDCCMTGTRIEDLTREAGKIRAALLSKYSSKGDVLRVIERPEYSLSPDDLSAYMRNVSRTGFRPDVLLIDYADLMVGGDKKYRSPDAKRHELNYIYTSLHRIAKEHNVVVVTATQANRAAFGKKIITLGEIAEDISKAWTSDHVIAICQSNKERIVEKRVRLFLAKNRSGKAYIEVGFPQDLERCTFAVPIHSGAGAAYAARSVSPEEVNTVAVDGDESEDSDIILTDVVQ